MTMHKYTNGTKYCIVCLANFPEDGAGMSLLFTVQNITVWTELPFLYKITTLGHGFQMWQPPPSTFFLAISSQCVHSSGSDEDHFKAIDMLYMMR